MRTLAKQGEGQAGGGARGLGSLHRSKPSVGMALNPCFRNEVLEFGLLHVWQESQNVVQIFLGVDAPAAAAFDDGIEDCALPTGIWMTNEEKILFADGSWSDRVFDQVMPTAGLCRVADSSSAFSA